MFKVISAFLISGIFLCGASSVRAETFESLKQRLDAIGPGPGQERCVKRWDILWPLAKGGDHAARYWLLFNMIPPPHYDVMNVPGYRGDYVSGITNAAILAAHTRYQESLGDYRKLYDPIIYVALLPLSAQPESKWAEEFLICKRETPESDCALIGIQDNLIPTFEDFSARIDALISQGYKPECTLYKD